jgi:hypothetical protein
MMITPPLPVDDYEFCFTFLFDFDNGVARPPAGPGWLLIAVLEVATTEAFPVSGKRWIWARRRSPEQEAT